MSEGDGFAMHGGCLCGGVRFELTEPPLEAGYCHCSRCQRRTGTAAGISARVNPQALRWLSGEQLIRGWRHPDGGAEKCFGSICGAHQFSRNPDPPFTVAIRMAAFDQAPQVPISYRQYVADAAPWEPIPDDGIPRFPEGRG